MPYHYHLFCKHVKSRELSFCNKPQRHDVSQNKTTNRQIRSGQENADEKYMSYYDEERGCACYILSAVEWNDQGRLGKMLL